MSNGMPILTLTESAARETRERERRWEATGKPAREVIALETYDPQAPGQGRRNRRFLCPLPACAGKTRTPDHRSLSVDTQTGAWKCHRCGTAGLLGERRTKEPGLRVAVTVEKRRTATRPGRDTFRKFWGLQSTPRQATQAAPTSNAEQATPEPAPEDWRKMLADTCPLPGTPGADYLTRRGIPLELAYLDIAKYAPRWYGCPALVFVLRDMGGAVVAAHGRMIDDTAKPNKRSAGPIAAGVYWTPGAYHTYVADPAEPLIITEAPIDALSLAAVGMTAIALCGVALREWAPKAFGLKRVLLAFDADKAGDDAAEEWANALHYGPEPERLRPQGGKDWNAMLMTHGPDALADFLVPYLRRRESP